MLKEIKKAAKQAEHCNKSRYNNSDLIQPHGYLIGFDHNTLTIEIASENITSMLSKTPKDLFGSKISDFLDKETISLIKKYRKDLIQNNTQSPIMMQIFINNEHEYDSLLYLSSSRLHLEIQTEQSSSHHERAIINAQYVKMVRSLAESDSGGKDIGNLICKTIAYITDMDRVYVCVFDNKNHGYVPFEENNGSMPTLLYHHFPSYDIPDVVRDMYTKNYMRHMPDIDNKPIRVVKKSGKSAKYDLTYSCLRAVSDSHLIYQRSMGVVASCSFSLVKEGKLWGIVGAHSTQPTYISFEKLSICRDLVEMFGVKYKSELRYKKKQDFLLQYQSLYQLVDNLSDFYSSYKQNASKGNIVTNEIAKLLNSHEMVVGFDGKENKFTNLTNKQNILLYSEINKRLKKDDITYTDNLSSWNKDFIGIKKACGTLAIRNNTDVIIAWIRKETISKQKWAGNPTTPLEYYTKDSKKLVSPRKSFDTWINIVKGKSEPWSDSDIEIATSFNSLFAIKYKKLQAEKSLYLLDSAINNAQDGVIITEADEIDKPGPRITYVNPAMQKISGYKANELIGSTPRVFQGEGTDKTELARLKKCLKQGKTFRGEILNYHKNGTPYWIDMVIIPVLDSKNKITHFTAIERDVTERKENEKKIIEIQKRYERAIEGSSDGLWEWNIDTNEAIYSPRFREMLGYKKENEFPNVFESFHNALHPDDVKKTMGAVNKHFKSKAPYDVTYRLKCKDGSYKWFRAKGKAIFKNKKPIQMSGSISDITEIKAQEQELNQQR